MFYNLLKSVGKQFLKTQGDALLKLNPRIF
jgi:hypothetical protein